MKKSKRKKQPKFPTCGYCQIWFDLPTKYRHLSFRYCPIGRIEITETVVGCGEFRLAKTFWCKRDKYWLGISVCLARRKKRKNGCVTCRQGKYFEKYLSKIQVSLIDKWGQGDNGEIKKLKRRKLWH